MIPSETPAAERANASIIQNLRVLGATTLGLVCVLGASLLVVQFSLGRELRAMEHEALAAETAIADVERAMSALHRRQNFVLSATTEAELTALRARAAITADLGGALARIASLRPRDGAAMRRQADEFLATDDALFEGARRRVELARRIEARRASVAGDLRALIEEVSGVSGVARLERVLQLRELQRHPGDARLVRAVVLGRQRAQVEAATEVVQGVLGLGASVGNLAVAPDQDALRGILANELPQNVAATRAAFESLLAACREEPEKARVVQAAVARWESLLADIAAPAGDASLVALRTSAFRTRDDAAALHARDARAGDELVATLERVERAVARSIETRADNTRTLVGTMRAGSIALLLAGAVALWKSRKRIRRSAAALHESNLELLRLRDELSRTNASLEQQVEARTASLAERESSLRLILDSTGDGLVNLDLRGRVTGEVSRAAVRWFGAPRQGESVAGFLFPDQPARAAMLELGLEQIADDVLPLELILAQLPERMSRDGLTLGLSWRPIHAGGALAGLLLVIADVTAVLEAEIVEQRAREEQAAVRQILHDADGFRVFISNSEALLAECGPESTRAGAKRALHTLKGNCAVMGFGEVARACHEIEDSLAEREDEPVLPAEHARLLVAWKESLERVRDYLEDSSELKLARDDYAALLAMIARAVPYNDIGRFVQDLTLTPSRKYLRRLAMQAEAVAGRLGKPVRVEVVTDDFRPDDAMQPFFSSLIHVVRNAVDHGLEAESERLRRGKAREGVVTLRSFVDDAGALHVEVADDGGGVDWEAVAARAADHGFATSTRDDLVNALFADGLSTRESITALSGRGVGLGAVRVVVARLGGTVAIHTARGVGTTFGFVFPLAHAVAEVA